MAETYFSLVVWTDETDMNQFKDCLESIDEQEYREFELYILDNNPSNAIEVTIKEFFPDIVDKVHYRRLKKKNGMSYAYNIGAHFAEGDYLVYLGQHDRLSGKTLSSLNEKIDSLENKECIIYADHDELIGLDRKNPHFKPDFNKELFLQTDYIGDFICISKSLMRRLGEFNEKAQTSTLYEYVLRAVFKNEPIEHVPSLIYHKRTSNRAMNKEERQAANFYCKEHMALAVSYLRQNGVICEGRIDNSLKKWHLDYDDSTFRRFSGDYMFLRDENVRLYTRNNVKKMYSYLCQPDVAVVGARFIDRGFTIDNIGYIYDTDGAWYPAFHGQSVFRNTYDGIGNMPRDVAVVDCGCCLIDAKVYRMLRGFDTRLTGQDAMFDFCLRARKRGYRIIALPSVIARWKNRELITSTDNHDIIMEKHGEFIEKGDMFYNKNLPIGMENYILPGTQEEKEDLDNNSDGRVD